MNARHFGLAIFARWLTSVGIAATCCALVACSSAQVVDHAFGFNATNDSPDIYVLDYRYGDSKQPSARNPDELRNLGKSPQGTGIHGPMLRGESLYVKWRIKSSAEVYEETVDLRDRLPKDIKDHRIYFLISGTQLYVYLVSPLRRPPDMPPNGPQIYQHYIVTTIYPDQKKP